MKKSNIELLTYDEINDLNRTELDIYYWKLYNHMVDTYDFLVSKKHKAQFNYVYKRLKLS